LETVSIASSKTYSLTARIATSRGIPPWRRLYVGGSANASKSGFRRISSGGGTTGCYTASYARLPPKSVRHGEAVPDGFQRRIRFGDLCSCQLPSRWLKAKWKRLHSQELHTGDPRETSKKILSIT